MTKATKITVEVETKTAAIKSYQQSKKMQHNPRNFLHLNKNTTLQKDLKTTVIFKNMKRHLIGGG